MKRILQQKKGKSDNVSFPLFLTPGPLLNRLDFPERQTHSFPVLLCDPCGVACYPPAPVGCCTIGLDGLVESVLVVVVDAAPSSRLRVMIHAIMGASSCLALLFPPERTEAGAQKIVGAIQSVKFRLCKELNSRLARGSRNPATLSFPRLRSGWKDY